MSYNKLILATLLSAMCLAGCGASTRDITAVSQLAPKAELASYKTYGWLSIEEVVHDPYGQWTDKDADVAGEVAWLIEREMRNRGFTMAKENPDVFVIFELNVDMAALALVKRNSVSKQLKVEQIPVGAIVVALVDAKTDTPFWFGYAEGKIKNAPPKEAKQRLDYAVTQMFKSLK